MADTSNLVPLFPTQGTTPTAETGVRTPLSGEVVAQPLPPRTPAPAPTQLTPPPQTPPPAQAQVTFPPVSQILPAVPTATEVVPQAPQQQPLIPLFPEDTVDTVPQSAYKIDQQQNLITAEKGWQEDPLNATRAVLDGITFGFSDEIGASIAAGAVAALDPSKNWSEVYDDMMADLQDQRNTYTAAHPYASLALNIAGGLLSPANKGISFVLSKAKTALTPAAQRLSTVLRSPKPVTPITVPPPVPGAMQRAGRFIATNAPAAAVGGAIYGAGATEQRGWDRLGAAGEGALMGLALLPAFATIPALGGFLARRRVAQDVGTGPDFKPLNLSADTTANPFLSWFYRNVVGRAFVGRSAIENQSVRWTTPLMRQVEQLTARLASAKKLSSETLALYTRSAATEARKLAAIVRNKERLTAREIRRIVGQMDDLQKKIDQGAADGAQLELVTTAVEQAFRSQAFQSALPDSFSAASRQAVLEALEMGQAGKALELVRQAWNQQGFPMLNGRKFQVGVIGERSVSQAQTLEDILAGRTRTSTEKFVDLSRISNNVIKAMENDGSLDLLISAENKLDFVQKEIISFLERAVDGRGFITGEQLSTLRNRIGELTASPGILENATASARRAIYLSLKDEIDNLIVSQLSPDELTTFRQHQAMYKSKLALEATVGKATNVNQRGNFTPENWVDSVRSLFPRLANVETAPFQREAYAAASARTAAEQAEMAVAREATALNAQKTIALLAEQEIALQNQLTSLRQEADRILEGAPRAAAAQAQRASRTGAIALESQIKSMEEELAQLTQARNELLSLLPNRGRTDVASPSENYWATLTLGQALSGMLKTGAMAVGMPLAYLFSRQGTQRLLAGQTWLQEGIQKLMASNNPLIKYPALGGLRSTVAGNEDRDVLTAVYATDVIRRANIYNALKNDGSLDEFKEQYPQTFKVIEASYNTVLERARQR
jgi:hypothetical protein